MEMPDWKVVVRTVAPALATALGTPLAGMATRVIADALLGPGTTDASEEALAMAVQSATPDQLIALKTADLQFKKDIAALGVDIERLANEDRDSARRREIQTGDLMTPRLLAGGVTLGFFGVLIWLLADGIPPNGGEALLVMLGSLGTAWAGVISYYFGSSAGSRHKSDLLAIGGSKP
jgi:ABC-type glycerol-3-phosphate transport system substrate-binding protein